MRVALMMSGLLFAAVPAMAQEHGGPEMPKQHWSFDGLFGTYDRASAQRGFQVYQQVCSSCHSMREMYYRNLADLGLNPEQVKAIAASAEVASLDDSGQPIQRAALPSDHFKAPYPNDRAARAANGGALPPDQSVIVKARENGSTYIFNLLNGYRDPPEGVKVGDGQYYNLWFPGHQLAMPKPLQDGQVTYVDGTPATVEQMSRDVVQFLTWAAEPEMEQRKRMGLKWVTLFAVLSGLTYMVKKKVWKDVH